jgi:hypothetical protein
MEEAFLLTCLRVFLARYGFNQDEPVFQSSAVEEAGDLEAPFHFVSMDNRVKLIKPRPVASVLEETVMNLFVSTFQHNHGLHESEPRYTPKTGSSPMAVLLVGNTVYERPHRSPMLVLVLRASRDADDDHDPNATETIVSLEVHSAA